MDIAKINKRRDCGKALLQNNDPDRIPTPSHLLYPTSNQTERSLTKSRKTIPPNFTKLLLWPFCKHKHYNRKQNKEKHSFLSSAETPF